MARGKWTVRCAPLLRVAGLGLIVAMAAGTSSRAVEDFDPETASPMCGDGAVYDSMLQACQAAAPGAVSDRMFWEYAYVLARFDRNDEADKLLGMVADQTSPRFWNVRGYVSRKLGKADDSVAAYMKALEADPDYINAREYLGEAYILQGKLDLAQEQLNEIEKRCGNTCTQYTMLVQAIKAAKPAN